MRKTKVVISRKWNNPKIEMVLDDEGIGMSMALDDFVAAMADEAAEPLAAAILAQMGSPALWVTKGQLEAAMAKALESVVSREVFANACERVAAEIKSHSAAIV